MARAHAQNGGVHEHDDGTTTSITVSVPAHDTESLQVEASCPLVGATPCLPWSAHIADHRAMPAYMWTCVFIRRCRLPNTGGAAMEGPRNPFNRESVLSITLSPATWTRIVTELICANGLLSRGPFLRIRDLLQALRALSISNPLAVTLGPEDAVITDPFDRPAQAARAVRGRQPAAAAIPAAPGPPNLSFLSRCTVSMLASARDELEPLAAWGILMGVLGNCYSFGARSDEFAACRLGADTLMDAIRLVLGRPDPSEPAATRTIKRTLLETVLPFVLQGEPSTTEAAEAELLDGAHYFLGSQEQREAVEARRVVYISSNECAAPPRSHCVGSARERDGATHRRAPSLSPCCCTLCMPHARPAAVLLHAPAARCGRGGAAGPSSPCRSRCSSLAGASTAPAHSSAPVGARPPRSQSCLLHNPDSPPAARWEQEMKRSYCVRSACPRPTHRGGGREEARCFPLRRKHPVTWAARYPPL